jgi:hypothetical protein
MFKFIEIISAITKILPLLVEAVELFAGAGEGAKKKAMVKEVVKSYVTKDPAYDGLIDVLIDKAVEKGINTGGSRTNRVKGDLADISRKIDKENVTKV